MLYVLPSLVKHTADVHYNMAGAGAESRAVGGVIRPQAFDASC